MKSLNVQEDSNGRTYIQDLTRVPVQTTYQVEELIKEGNALRISASNQINSFSSRSHAILQLVCYQPVKKTRSILTIIDLAGSERSSQVSASHYSKNSVLQK